MATTLEQNTLEAQAREAGSKNDARKVRRGGKIPAVVYGAGKDSLSISVDPRHVQRILNSETGHNTIFDLALSGGEQTKAMIVDWQYEPIKGHLLHIDLKRIALDKVLRVSVPVRLVGEAAGVKQEGGIMEQMLREVEIECLPGDIPSHIDADVSALDVWQGAARFGVAAFGQDQVHHGREPARGARHLGEGRSGRDAGSSGGGSGGLRPSPKSSRRASRRPRKKAPRLRLRSRRRPRRRKRNNAGHGSTRIHTDRRKRFVPSVRIRENPWRMVWLLLEAVLKA